MAPKKFLLLFLYLGLNLVSTENEIKITFFIDKVQKADYDNDISDALEDLETIQPHTQVQDTVLELSGLQEDMENFCDILSNVGSHVIVDLSCRGFSEGYELARAQGIPIIKLASSMEPFLNAFKDYLWQKNANNIVLIFENAHFAEEALEQMQSGYPFRTIIMDASAMEQGGQLSFLKKLKDLRPPPAYFGVFSGSAAMNNIISSVHQSGLYERTSEWHLIFLDPRDGVFKSKRISDGATKFTLSSRHLCQSMRLPITYCSQNFTLQRGILLDVMNGLSGAFQAMDDAAPSYVECNATESSVPEEQLKRATDLLRHIDVTQFLTAVESDTETLDNILALQLMINISMNLFSNGHDTNTLLAVHKQGQLKLINSTISPSKRFFRIGTAESVPWSYYRRDESGQLILDSRGAPIWEGYCIDFMEALAKKLNFGYEIVAPKRGLMGQRDEFGQWDGVVGDLVSGETDFAIAALKMYSEREEVIDFLPPYFDETGISIVIRKERRRTSLFKFMTVLRMEVWVSMLCALIGTAFMIWLLDKYSPYSSRNNREAYSYPIRMFTLRESFWFALTSFTPQGGGEAPKSISGRVLVAAYWLFVVLMLATFTANLAAFLTVERMQTPVQSLEQLSRQSRINYTVVQDSDAHHFFINMKFAEETLYNMWKTLVLNETNNLHKFRIWDYPIKEQYGHILLAINGSKPVIDAREGFRKVNEHLNADFAFIHDSSEIKYELTRNCNMTEVGEVFSKQPYAVAVQQGSNLGDELSFAILELQKVRFFEDLKDKYWSKSNSPKCPLSEHEDGISLDSLGGVFIATIIGLLLAMATLSVELWQHRKQQKSGGTKFVNVKPFKSDASTLKLGWQAADKDKQEAHKMRKVTPPPTFNEAIFGGQGLPPSFSLAVGKFKSYGRANKLQRSNRTDPSSSGYIE